MNPLNWIDTLFFGVRRVFSAGSEMPERPALNFTGSGVAVTDDPTNNRTTVTIAGGGDDGDVAPTPNTLALRGSSGEVRATRVESSSVRTTVGGDVALQHGETTFAQFRSTDPCAAPGHVRIDATSGQLLTYLAGSEVSVFTQHVRWPKVSPDANAADTLTIPIFAAPGYLWTITSVTFTPNDNLTANATDYADLRIRILDSSASFVGDAAIALTKPSGANSTGDWFELQPVSFTLDSLLLALPIDVSHQAVLRITKPNSGVPLPAGLLTMTVIPWLGPLP